MTPSRCRHVRSAAVAATAVATLAGCGFDRTLADRNTLGGNTVLPTLASEPAPPPEPGRPLMSLSRGEWQPIDFLVPVDGTVHGPLWRIDLRVGKGLIPPEALYPTIDQALDVRRQGRPESEEGLLQPVVSLVNVAALPIMIPLDPPGNHMSPSRAMVYKRSPQGRPMAGPIPAQPPMEPKESQQ